MGEWSHTNIRSSREMRYERSYILPTIKGIQSHERSIGKVGSLSKGTPYDSIKKMLKTPLFLAYYTILHSISQLKNQ